MGKSRKQTKRGHHYQTMAAGYQILRSPLAGSYTAAAEHYHASDLPHDPAVDAYAGPDLRAAPNLEPGNVRD
jgi:hypothetical protein